MLQMFPPNNTAKELLLWSIAGVGKNYDARKAPPPSSLCERKLCEEETFSRVERPP